MKSSCLLAILFCFSANIYAQQKLNDQQSTILWKVSPVKHPEIVSYMLGSDHRYGEKFLNSIPVIKEKVLASDVVVTEMALPDSASFKESMTQKASYTDLFSKEDAKVLDSFLLSHHMNTIRELDSVHFPVNMLIFYVQMEIMASKNIELNNNSSMDNVILHWSMEAGKPTVALDSGMAIRKNVLSFGLGDTDIAKYILALIRNPESVTENKPAGGDEYGSLKLNYHFSEYPDFVSDSSLKHLLVDRNEFWLPKLYTLLNSKNCFIVVGNAHLKYKNGLIKSLSSKGFKVSPIAIMRTSKLSD